LAEVREKPKDSGVYRTTPLVIRAIGTPKEKLLWVRTFDAVAELAEALREFQRR